MRLILASASPRRAELLRAAGLPFDVLPVAVDERASADETPDACVRRLASMKSAAGWAASRRSDALVLGADTLVVVDGTMLGKPGSDEEARQMLARLSGRTHQVLTGISVRHRGGERCEVDTTDVFFAPLGTAEIDWYVQSGEGRDKAGAYAIQGLASRFVERIEGSYSNVVGLPVALVYQLIREVEPRCAFLASGVESRYPAGSSSSSRKSL